MKKVSIFFLHCYQLFLSPFLHMVFGFSHACRYYPTCSEYAKEQIQENGFYVGVFRALKRIVSCNPFAKVTEDKV